jgi:hypothetical protein
MDTADEVGACTNLYPMIQAWARNLHAAGVPNLVVMPPTPALFDDGSGTGRSAVDIWAVLPFQYDNNVTYVQQALGKGDSVWSYNALMQDSYSPKWQIDYAPIAGDQMYFNTISRTGKLIDSGKITCRKSASGT